ncbi:MAG: gamma-glutamyltransferase [Gemmatimonadales bacterium]
MNNSLPIAVLSLMTVTPLHAQARPPVPAAHGVVATSQRLASEAGREVLARGGNAVDAAVAAAAVLAVVEPHMTGIGGDMFALVWWAPERRLVALRSSGRAGAGMTREAILARGHTTVPDRGPEPVTVPGALAGWDALVRRYGTRPLAELLQPAIRIADSGFAVTPNIARQWAGNAAVLRRDAGARHTFLVDGVRAPAAGEWFRNPDLAATLRQVAAAGPATLYGGDLGARLVERLGQLGGFLTLEDLRSHEVEWVAPISAPYRGYRLWELPPPNQGIAALMMLRLLEPYDLAALGHNSAPYLHRLIEAKKLAFADLARYVGDERAMKVGVAALLGDDYLAGRRRLLDTTRAMERTEPGNPATASETIYLTTADSAGNMVSFINSLYEEFGSGIVVPGTGFALQDRGAGFSLEPGLPNTVAPGKRPRHTLIPAFVTRSTPAGDEPWLSFGVMGGAMQPQGHVQVLLDLVLFGMDPQQAADAPRFRHYDGLRVGLEEGMPAGVREALAALGHEVETLHPDNAGGAQLILREGAGYLAGSDRRKDGGAAGW